MSWLGGYLVLFGRAAFDRRRNLLGRWILRGGILRLLQHVRLVGLPFRVVHLAWRGRRRSLRFGGFRRRGRVGRGACSSEGAGASDSTTGGASLTGRTSLVEVVSTGALSLDCSGAGAGAG